MGNHQGGWPDTWPEPPEAPSELLRAITAKTDQTGQTTNTLSLVQHGRDSAAVAGWLWDNWLPRAVTQRFAHHFGSMPSARTYAQWIAACHDAGKSSSAFQFNLSRNGDPYGVRSRLERAGFEFPPGSPVAHVPHCRIGQGVVGRWLGERFPDQFRNHTTVAALVGAHHGVAATLHEVTGLRNDWFANVVEHDPWDAQWIQAQNEFLDLMTGDLNAYEAICKALTNALTPSLQVTLAGLIVVADWLASDAERFPYVEGPDMTERLENADLWRDILPPWRPEVPDQSDNLLASRFGFSPETQANSGQQLLVDAAYRVETPSLFVFEAPTGSGKTEAALMAAETLAARFGNGGLEFLLPTRGTADGVWERLKPWVERLPDQGRQSVALAHGKSGLNDSFMELSQKSRYAAVASDGADPDLAPHDCANSTEAWVSSWFSGRRKATLATMVAGTIDQLLLASLQTRHVALRQFGLTGKVVIIDECHSVDEYMLVYLERALEWLGAHGVPTIAMSATLPDDTRRRLIEAYAGHRDEEPLSPSPVRLTVASTTGVKTSTTQPSRSDRFVVPEFLGLDETTIRARARSAVQDGACVAIIRNTVREAQATYLALREELGEERVQLLHSRFLGVHRATRERELRECLGPKASQRPAGFIIVATQVLEVSLDIDVDLMITDIAPIDVLFQRAGRLHRHRRGEREEERPVAYRAARLTISGCAAPHEDDAPELASGSVAVYGAYRLLRCLAALKPMANAPVSLHDIARLVQEAYQFNDQATPEAWNEAVRAAENEHNMRVADQNVRAQAFLLPKAGRRFKSMSDLMPHRSSEPPTDARAAAQVRDSDESIEVIVVRVDDYGAYPMPHTKLDEGAPIPFDFAPEHWQARELARCTVTLPARLGGYEIDQTVRALEGASARFAGWQNSPLLRGELVLPLDNRGETTLCGVNLRYAWGVGLIEVNDTKESK